VKLRRVASTEQIIDLPGARLVPDVREGSVDVSRLVSVLSSATVDEARLEAAIAGHAARGGSLFRVFLEETGVDDRTLAFSVARQLQIPLADLRTSRPAAEALVWIDPRDAHRFGVLPVAYDGRNLTVAVIDPLDADLLHYLERLSVAQVNLSIAPANEIRAAINQSYQALAEVNQLVEAFVAESAPAQIDLGDTLADGFDDDAPVIQVVNKIVTQALRDRASDVHIEPLDTKIRVRFRIDGALSEVLDLPVNMGPALCSRIKIMADMNIVERRRPQDGQFQMKVDGREVDVRVSTTSTIFGEKTVLRLLDKSRSLMRLSDLGMPAEAGAIYAGLVRSPFGMVVVSGPTGSGKTTTLYATLNEINRTDINIMTIEDPVEYVFPSINQIQINAQADVTFAAGLKSILRQDPDVILVGEVRDVETARIAVQSALTGHLVLSSVHAVDTVAALYRLLDMGIESFLIASSITCVVAQRLVRKICTSCKVEYSPSTADLALYDQLGGPAKTTFYKGAGCSFCSNTGYHGRVGVYEVLPITEEIRTLVIDHRPPREVRDLAMNKGLKTLRDEAIRLVFEDHTTMDEVLRNVYVAEGAL
jgi:type IV pilus assembly protein PilB